MQEMNANNHQITPKDQKKIVKIITEFFEKQANSPEEVQQCLAGVAKVIQHPGGKLVHFDDTVFLILVKEKGQVEVYNLSLIKNFNAFTKNFGKLMKYLKAIHATHVTTSSDDTRYDTMMRKLHLKYDRSMPKDKNYTYKVEL